ncbi:MAG: nucleotidyltransferase family protein [Chloroflexi bacterium]|nr:nucleotidyltransferase family protein [Chloroflexota bacterium]
MITAIILAAGDSKRMGQPKMLMPWGRSTVLQTVISTLQTAGMNDILVVTGGARKQVEMLIGKSVQTVFNENYAQGEMLSSIQTGLAAKKHEASAALICLGDQPQVQVRSVQRILQEYKETKPPIIVPSYKMQRGHPWLVARELWDELLKMRAPQTPREFLDRHAKIIHYVELDTASTLQDIDTPEDYLQSHP